MLIVEWAPVTEINIAPPLGDALLRHLLSYKGTVRCTSYSAWNLLHQVLLQNDLPVSDVCFTESGKPFFKDGKIHFSISHSKGLCAVAVSDRPVGTDIELCRASYPFRMIEKSLSPREREAFDGDFTRIWSRKEAVAKMTGEGISGYPNQIDTTGFDFREKRIDHDGQNYWLVAVTMP